MAEGTMGWYRVCLNTIVRKDVKLDSERLRILPMGSRVNVVKKDGRRVMIDQPIKGWCSLSSSNGDTILKPLSDDTTTQTPRSNPEAQAAHYKQEAAKAEQQAKNEQNEEEKKALTEKARKYDALAAQVTAQEKAHKEELESLAAAANSTNVTDMLFRDGDVIQLVQKNHGGDIVIVRCLKMIDGKEWIGADYERNGVPFLPAENGTHPLDKNNEVHFTSSVDRRQGWVLRTDVQGYLPAGSVISQLNDQVLANQLLQSTLAALQSIIKDLNKTKYPGLADEIKEQAKIHEMQE